jgi:bla regulator protein blaR1
MAAFLLYLIRSIAISGVLTTYYLAALRNRRLHAFNRYYLLSTLALSLVLPLSRFSWTPWKGPDDGPVRKVIADLQIPNIQPYGDVHPYLLIGLELAAIVSIGLLVILAIKIVALYRQRSKQPRQIHDGYNLIETDDPGAPFSFGNNLFWRRGVDPANPLGRRMLTHELAHIRGHHTRDILFAQSTACIFWINPFFWFIRQELTMVHEFIADQACCPEGDTESFARMLLLAHNAGSYLQPSHRFFHSPIKRRLTMLINDHRPRRIGLALALPVLIAVITILSCSKELPANNAATLKLKAENEMHLEMNGVKLKFLPKELQVKVMGINPNGKTFQPDGKEYKLQLNYKLESSHQPDHRINTVYIVGSDKPQNGK